LNITLTPVNPPIYIPANGGNFNFTVMVHRAWAPQAPFWVWARIKNPDGSYTAPTLGPVRINPPVALIISRVRTQTIPSSWPAGIYAYKGYAHATFSYPATDSSSFLFAKNASANGDLWITDASCTGEPFPGERSVTAIIPSGLELKASPNPFNATTAIRFELRVASLVNLKVYDSNGRLVATLVEGWREAGDHEVTFYGSTLASGVYLAKLTSGGETSLQKVMLLK
jgi:hypothetical protein